MVTTYRIVRHHNGYAVQVWIAGVFAEYLTGQYANKRSARQACIADGARDSDITYA